MKYFATLIFLILLPSGCSPPGAKAKLLNEQKLLKDSINHLNERIGSYIQNGDYENEMAQKKQVNAVHARLADIQRSIDRLEKRKQ